MFQCKWNHRNSLWGELNIRKTELNVEERQTLKYVKCGVKNKLRKAMVGRENESPMMMSTFTLRENPLIPR